MNPGHALELQIAAYRRMTGEERLALALRLHESACEISRAGIRSQHPQATEEEVARRLRERIAAGSRLRNRERRKPSDD